MNEGSGRAEVERRLVARSLQDDDFRRRLLAAPRAAVEEELGTGLPEGVRVEAVEETAETIYLVLPSTSPLGEEGGELSDLDLEAVAGGGTWVDPTCASCDPCVRTIQVSRDREVAPFIHSWLHRLVHGRGHGPT